MLASVRLIKILVLKSPDRSSPHVKLLLSKWSKAQAHFTMVDKNTRRK